MQNLSKIRFRVYLLSLYLMILPIDSALGNIIGSTSIVNYLLIAYVLLRVITLLMKEKIKLKSLQNSKMHILYFLYFIVSLSWADIYNLNSWFLISFSGGFMMFLLCALDTYSIDEYNILKKSIIFSGIIVIITIILNYENYSGGRLILTIGRYMDPNFFATGLVLIVALLLDNIFNKIYSKINILLFISIMIIIIMTGSRGALLANLAVVATYFLLTKENMIKKGIVVLIAIVFLMIALYLMSDYIPISVLNRFALNEMISSKGTGRITNWVRNISFYLNSSFLHLLFGSGLSSYPTISLKTLGIPQVAHNLYVQSLIEGGMIGFIITISMLVSSIKNAFKNNRFVVAALMGVVIGGMSIDINMSRFFWNVLFFSTLIKYEQNINISKKIVIKID